MRMRGFAACALAMNGTANVTHARAERWSASRREQEMGSMVRAYAHAARRTIATETRLAFRALPVHLGGAMKIFLLFVATVIATPFARAQQAAPEPPLVSTSGTAEVKVVPDLADLHFEIEVRNAELVTARKQQGDRAAKVLAAIRALGIAEADLQAADISITPNFTESRRDYVETAKVRFFSVSQVVAVTLHDVKKVPDVIAAAVGAGATEARLASLRTSQLRKHRDAARANAIKAAKEKAVALASELGVKVGKPYRISEVMLSPHWGGNSFSNNSAQISAPGGGGAGGDGEDEHSGAAFAPGTISITATVAVSFLLE